MPNQYSNRSFTIPLVLLVLCANSYGILVPWLGWYWDDWPSIWFLRVLGASGFTNVFTVDRPPLGYLFTLTTAILRDSRLGWHIFGFVSRWLSCVAFWWFLKQLWKDKLEPSAWAAILFTIYPGFYQQFIPITYSHMYLILALVLFSLGIIVKGLKAGSKFWNYYVISLVSAAYSTFTLEYFFGLELLRPVIIWIALKEKQPKPIDRLKKVVQVSIPYWMMVVLFLYWRLKIHPTPRGQVHFSFDSLANILQGIRSLIPIIFEDIVQSSLLVWLKTFDIKELNQFGLLPTLAYASLVSVVAAGIIFFLLKYRQWISNNTEKQLSFNFGMITLGVIALFTAGWPFWMTRLPIELYFPWDRFTLAFMVGVSLVFTGILGIMPIRPTYKIFFLGIIAGAAVGTHFRTANDYRREWNTEKDFFWQIAWRAPQIKPGTVLITSELPFQFSSDNSFTAPINMMYAPKNDSSSMSYLFVSIEARMDTYLTSLRKGLTINQSYRSFSFSGSTSQALVLYYSPPGCVRFLDPAIHSKLPQKPKYFAKALQLSDLSLIDADPSSPAEMPASIFGAEPEHNWCYYYEKADLARQLGNWQLAADLGEKAFSLQPHLYEINAPEYLPYIEANAQLGNWEKAMQLSQDAYDLNFRMQRILCDTWLRISKNTPSSIQQDDAVRQITTQFQCQP